MSSFFVVRGSKIYMMSHQHTLTGTFSKMHLGSLFTPRGFCIPIGPDSNHIVASFKDPDYDIECIPIPVTRAVLIRPNGTVALVVFIQKKELNNDKATIAVEDLHYSAIDQEFTYHRTDSSTSTEVLATLLHINDFEKKSMIELLKTYKELTMDPLPGVIEFSVYDVMAVYSEMNGQSFKEYYGAAFPMMQHTHHDFQRPQDQRITNDTSAVHSVTRKASAKLRASLSSSGSSRKRV